MATGNRSAYWDAWKGIAIIAVVIIHVSATLIHFSTISKGHDFWILFRQLLCFPVPIFLALAGYFSAQSRGQRTGVSFCAERFVRILPPYLFWTLVTVLLRSPSHLVIPSLLIEDVFFGKGIGIGYFVIVLLQFVLLTPMLIRFSTKDKHLAFVFLFSVLSMSFTYSVRINWPDSLSAQFPFYALAFFYWYPFYHFGLFAANRELPNCIAFAARRQLFLWLFVLFTMASMLEGIFLSGHELYAFAVSQIKVTSFLASFFLFLYILASYRDKSGNGMQWLVWLGRHSYPIYLIHIICVTVIYKLNSKYGVSDSDSDSVFFVLTASLLVLTLTAAFIELLKRVLSRSLIRNCLGV